MSSQIHLVRSEKMTIDKYVQKFNLIPDNVFYQLLNSRNVSENIVNQFLKRMHVPLLSPAHIGRRIINTFFFVLRIVSSRSIRAGHFDL